MSRLVHPEEVWGTVVVIDLRSDTLSEDVLKSVRDEMTAYFHDIDRIFSTYKPESEISALRTGQLSIDDALPIVKEIWQLCIEARECTEGAFDPWAARGGFDPSGYVKGWAADRALDLAREAGVEHVQINAGGDISLLGGMAIGEPWRIGIRHPDDDHNCTSRHPLRWRHCHERDLRARRSYRRPIYEFAGDRCAFSYGRGTRRGSCGRARDRSGCRRT
jgi:thiamine biosynthesis lipoprotein